MFERAQYTDTEVCRRFGIERLEEFADEFDRAQVVPWDSDAAGVLTRLFIEGPYVPLSILEAHFDSESIGAMAELGLLETHPGDPNMIASPVAAYPCADVWIVSDRWRRPDGGAFQPDADVVYPAIVSNAQQFLRRVPQTPCSRFLDLCSGTAVAALQAARRFAGQVWAFDIAERSTHFGEFNRRLNGISNATISTGDLYAPADGMTFDRIVAHPPYVPVLRPKWIYHDGGEDGEQIIRRTISELPSYLEPGGLFYMLGMGSDRTDAPFERRIRGWLGEQEADFDIVAFPVRSIDPEDFAVRAVTKSPTSMEDARRFKSLFRELGVQAMTYAAILIQRRADDRTVFTLRRNLGAGATIDHMLWLLDWETRSRQPGATEMIMGTRVRSNRDAELRVVHRLSDDGWQVTEHLLQTVFPFSMEARADPWIPYMMNYCDGTKTVADYFEQMKTDGIVPDAPADEFARAIAVLVSGGFLQVEK
jgi:methylase of polypeptide subunit release factors